MHGSIYRGPFACLVVAIVSCCAAGQDPASPTENRNEQVQARIKLLTSAPDLDDVTRQSALEIYNKASAAIDAAAAYRVSANAFQKRTEDIGSQLASVKEQLSISPAGEGGVPVGLPLKEVESAVQQMQVELQSAKRDLSVRSNDVDAREERLLSLPTENGDANQRLSEAEQQLNTPPPTNENAKLTEAKTFLAEAHRDSIRAEIDVLTAEANYLAAARELLPLRRDAAKVRVDALERKLQNWNDAARSMRETKVQKEIRETAAFAKVAPDSLGWLAEANVKTAERRREFESKLQRTIAKRESVDKLRTTLEEQFSRAQKEAGTRSSITQTIGEILRSKRDDLQTYDKRMLSATELKTRADDARVQLFVLGEELAELSDIDLAVQTQANERQIGEEDTRILKDKLKDRVALLSGLQEDAKTVSQELVRLESTQGNLQSIVEDYTTFIDERVLWIRSTDPFSLDHARQAGETVQRMVAPRKWRDLAREVLQALIQRPISPLISTIVIAMTLAFGSRFRSQLRENGKLAASRSCRDFSLTLNAILLTVGVAAVWPILLYLVGSWLRSSVGECDARLPLANGLISAASVLFPLDFWRQSARDNGLMSSHFSVEQQAASVTRRNLNWFAPMLTVLVGLSAGISKLVIVAATQSFGRILFCTIMIGCSVFLYRIVNPHTGMVAGYLAKRRESLLEKTRYVWLSLLVAGPLALVLLALFGYQFTAEKLASRILWTGVTLLCLWFLNSIALRWVMLSRRRLAVEQARARLAKATEQADKTGSASVEAQADIESIDITNVDTQTRRLLRVVTVVSGVFLLLSLWVDVLPALSRFDEVEAWKVEVSRLSETGDAGGSEVGAATTGIEMVSYADVVMAILILIGMVFAMRDIPGLLELLVLQHLPLDVALRFAITTLTRYIIFVVGIIWAGNRIHIGWAQAQWLVAGVSVGLGFGLQEIFANFVSGLIVLFERPLRAGDIVTIDGVTGVVKNIRLRSTVIQDWDRKDLIVPNKDFVTGRLLNWTLSDEVNRIVIPLGVAYGTDMEKAKSLIRQIAQDHPLTVADPGALVTFEEFGDNSLNLILRCYISMKDMPFRLRVVDELHTQIDLACREANIEIPFPQRDLHIRSDVRKLA